jgi:hypothetical protein
MEELVTLMGKKGLALNSSPATPNTMTHFFPAENMRPS